MIPPSRTGNSPAYFSMVPRKPALPQVDFILEFWLQIPDSWGECASMFIKSKSLESMMDL
jgi:hypothetical protein